MRKAIATIAMLSVALSLSACSGSGDKAPSAGDEQPQEQVAETPEQAQETPAQTFETDQALVEYRDTQDVAGNTMVNFALTNKTESTLMVGSDNLVLNGQYSIKSLGGSATDIAPSMIGSVSLVFGVPAQTDLAGTSDIQTLSGELVLFDADEMQEVGRVPFNVVI
jgi:hypothetical protein